MSSIKNSWTQGRSKESHPPGIVFPIIATKQSSPWLPAPNGIEHFIAVSLAIFHLQVWVISGQPISTSADEESSRCETETRPQLTAHIRPLIGHLGPLLASDWLEGTQANQTYSCCPPYNIPKSCCNSNILIFYQWLANSNRRKIKLTFSSSTQLQIWNNIIIICLSSDAITPGLSPECEENCKFD